MIYGVKDKTVAPETHTDSLPKVGALKSPAQSEGSENILLLLAVRNDITGPEEVFGPEEAVRNDLG
jgi:hypothetical protein